MYVVGAHTLSKSRMNNLSLRRRDRLSRKRRRVPRRDLSPNKNRGAHGCPEHDHKSNLKKQIIVKAAGKRILFPFPEPNPTDRKSTRLNSSHQIISYAVFCLKKKKTS